MKSMMPRHPGLVILSVLLVSACAGGEGRSQRESGNNGELGRIESADEVVTASFSTADDDVARVARLGKLLLGHEVSSDVAQGALRAGGQTGSGTADMPSGLRVTHVQRNGGLLVISGDVADDHSESADIGEEAARRVFEDTVQKLQAEGAPEVQGIDLRQVRVNRLRQVAGRLGQPETMNSRVKQYVFSAPRSIDGVAILDSSITVGVHRDGKLASIRTTGVLPAQRADARSPVRRARRTSSKAARTRLEHDFPGADVHPVGLSYVAQPNGAESTLRQREAVEPLEVFLVFPPLLGSEGRGRGLRVAYSVTDPNAPAIYLDRARAGDKGDPRK